jgi:hypothetical protein
MALKFDELREVNVERLAPKRLTRFFKEAEDANSYLRFMEPHGWSLTDYEVLGGNIILTVSKEESK